MFVLPAHDAATDGARELRNERLQLCDECIVRLELALFVALEHIFGPLKNTLHLIEELLLVCCPEFLILLTSSIHRVDVGH